MKEEGEFFPYLESHEQCDWPKRELIDEAFMESLKTANLSFWINPSYNSENMGKDIL